MAEGTNGTSGTGGERRAVDARAAGLPDFPTPAFGTDALVTSTTLLEGLRDGANQTAWRRWVERYRPLLVAWARRNGVPSAECEDLAQTILLEFARAYREGKYERDRGRLRGWLFGIARNQLRSSRRHAGRADRGGRKVADATEGAELLAEVADEADPEEVWTEEWRRAVLRQCLDQIRREVRPATMRAFELFALDGLPAQEVARLLATTPNAIFVAKRRILRRIGELLPLMDDVF
jgi:RNA polymerase sigma-70 factor (ECF subfamily)